MGGGGGAGPGLSTLTLYLHPSCCCSFSHESSQPPRQDVAQERQRGWEICVGTSCPGVSDCRLPDRRSWPSLPADSPEATQAAAEGGWEGLEEEAESGAGTAAGAPAPAAPAGPGASAASSGGTGGADDASSLSAWRAEVGAGATAAVGGCYHWKGPHWPRLMWHPILTPSYSAIDACRSAAGSATTGRGRGASRAWSCGRGTRSGQPTAPPTAAERRQLLLPPSGGRGGGGCAERQQQL